MKNSSLYITLPVLLSYFVMGFVDVVGVSTGYAQRDFNLSPELAQLIPSMVFIWFFALSIPVSILQSKYGKKNALITGISLTALAMFIPFIHYTYYSILLSFLLLGIGNTIIQVSSNPLLKDVTSSKRFSSFMSLSQFIKAISSLLGPIIVAFAASTFGDWRNVFLVYGFISIGSGLWLAFTKVEESVAKEAVSIKSALLLLKNPFVLSMVLAIFFLVGIDVGLNTNIQGLLMSKFGLDLESASLGISAYFFSLMISRFVGAILLSRINNYLFFSISSFLTVVFLVCLLFTSTTFWAIGFIVLIGLASGNLFPLIFSLTINRMPEKANEISGLMIMAVVGGAVIPPLMGFVQKELGVVASFTVLCLCAAYICASTLIYKKTLTLKYV